MKSEFCSIWKNLNQIIHCVLIVSCFFLSILIFDQKVSEANETPESVIVSLKTQGRLKEAMGLVDEYISICSTNEAFSNIVETHDLWSWSEYKGFAK